MVTVLPAAPLNATEMLRLLPAIAVEESVSWLPPILAKVSVSLVKYPPAETV